jgi:hypothetical protein
MRAPVVRRLDERAQAPARLTARVERYVFAGKRAMVSGE